MHWMQSNLALADDVRGLSSDGEFCYRRTYLNKLSPFWVPLSVRLVRLPWLTTPSVGIEELKHRRQGKRIVLVSDRGVERHNAEASVLGQQTVCCPDTVFARAASATHGSLAETTRSVREASRRLTLPGACTSRVVIMQRRREHVASRRTAAWCRVAG